MLMQRGMHFGQEAQRRGDGNAGVADAVAEPVRPPPPARSASMAARTPAICERQRLTQTSDTSPCRRIS